MKEIEIGEITFSDIINEDEIGRANIQKLGTCKICVFSNEGPIPHFHVRIKNGSHNSDRCICIYEPKFFIHGSKINTLNNTQLEELDSWLRKSYKKNNELSNWEAIERFWSENNNNDYKNQYNPEIIQPDYTKIATEKVKYKRN